MNGSVLVSACLLGERCRYDGRSKPSEAVARFVEGRRIVRVCPERDGGLPVPRRPSHLEGGDGFAVLRGDARVVDDQGRDVTSFFLEGGRIALERARAAGVTTAVLKERSPSCGLEAAPVSPSCGKPCSGVACAMLLGAGIEVLTEEDLQRGGANAR